jgi:hypothetical protein
MVQGGLGASWAIRNADSSNVRGQRQRRHQRKPSGRHGLHQSRHDRQGLLRRRGPRRAPTSDPAIRSSHPRRPGCWASPDPPRRTRPARLGASAVRGSARGAGEVHAGPDLRYGSRRGRAGSQCRGGAGNQCRGGTGKSARTPDQECGWLAEIFEVVPRRVLYDAAGPRRLRRWGASSSVHHGASEVSAVVLGPVLNQ